MFRNRHGLTPVTYTVLNFGSFLLICDGYVYICFKVYEGGSLLLNVTGTSVPAPFAISSGSFRVVFESDAILTDEGFSLTYSIGEFVTGPRWALSPGNADRAVNTNEYGK